MREIKFRGKVVEDDIFAVPKDRWVYGFYYQDIDGGEIKHYIKNGPVAWEVLPETVGQFTGARTQDGKEIYEGDFVGIGEWDSTSYYTYLVVWSNYNNAWGYHRDDSYPTTLNEWLYCTMTVCGNIHDNPEMLK